MLTIKLQRVGKKKQPQFRFVLVEKGRDPFGHAKEILGFYHPRTNPSTVEVKKDRVEYWLSKGAQCTETVWNLFVNHGIAEGEKRKTIALSNKRRAKIADKAKASKEAEEAKKAAEEAKKAEEAAAKEAEAQAEAAPAEAPAEAAPEAEAPAEEKAEEKPAEAPAEAAAEAPAEETKSE